MEASELLERLAAILERLDIPYLITGSLATIAYGEPRFTNDIDVVVDLRPDQAEAFHAAFPAPEYYCSLEAVRQAVERRFQFNVLHPRSGLKIDVMVATDSEYDQLRLRRGIRIPGGPNLSAWFISPEDVIVKKMEFFQIGGSEKHIRDILGVLKIRAERVDREYIATWAARLGLTEVWQEVLKRVEEV